MKKEVETLAHEYADNTEAAYTEYMSMFEAFVAGYEAAKPKWIRVEDSPKESGAYLTITKPDPAILGYNGCKKMYIKSFLDGEWHHDLDIVTHWMPLPELPEVEEDE